MRLLPKGESQPAAGEKGPAWLKPACDYAPLLVFLAVYFASDILTATAALMAATLLAVVASWAVARAIPWLPLFAAAILGVFGGLTLAFEDEIWLKIRPTVMQVIFAVALYGSLLLGKPLLKRPVLPDHGGAQRAGLAHTVDRLLGDLRHDRTDGHQLHLRDEPVALHASST